MIDISQVNGRRHSTSDSVKYIAPHTIISRSTPKAAKLQVQCVIVLLKRKLRSGGENNLFKRIYSSIHWLSYSFRIARLHALPFGADKDCDSSGIALRFGVCKRRIGVCRSRVCEAIVVGEWTSTSGLVRRRLHTLDLTGHTLEKSNSRLETSAPQTI
jgi:hypothetical protein